MSVLFKRDIAVYISTVESSFTTANTTKLNILGDYSLTTSSRSSSSNLNRISDTPERLPFVVTDRILPATFKFSTYAKPVMNTTNHSSVEKLLYDSLGGIESTEGASNYQVNFASVNELIPLYIFISFEDKYYKLSEAVVKSANISFAINEITKIEWEVEAKDYAVVSSIPGTYRDVATNVFLKNKLTITTAQWQGNTYTLPVISGSLNITNMIEFPQRRTLDVNVSTPLSHITKVRSVSASLKCYIHKGAGKSGEFYDEVYDNYLDINDATDITGYIGGNVQPYIYFNIPNSIIELPKKTSDDVISFELKLKSREVNFGTNDDITLQYKVQ